MKKIALKVAYIGTHFFGFQRQPDLRTVEGELIKALVETGILDESGVARFRSAGRTDKGVHALGNVVTFFTDEDVIINQINSCLPDDVYILGKASVPYGFKTRYAYRRHYRYVLPNDGLNIELMKEASKKFEGRHDFTNFSRRVEERNPIRYIEKMDVVDKGEYIWVDVIGESFLWQMVRKMVKVLFDIGKEEYEPEKIDEFLDTEEKVYIEPMPPENLILMKVMYKPPVKFEHEEKAYLKFMSKLEEELTKYRSAYFVRETMSEFVKEEIDKRKENS